MQGWGLILLLISKAVGHAPTVPDLEQDKSAGVLHSQRALAEITEMIRISFLIHQVRVCHPCLLCACLTHPRPLSEHGQPAAADRRRHRPLRVR